MYPTVKYELNLFEQLLSVQRQNAGDRGRQQGAENTIGSEAERIRQTFIHEVFTFSDERHLERYIQYHQQALIRMIDKASAVEGDAVGTSDQYFYDTLEALLSFVERHFAKYFDQDAKAPESYINMAKQDAAGCLAELRPKLEAYNTDPQLMDIALHVFKKLVDENANITYRKVMYVKEVYKELIRLLDNYNEGSDFNEELCLALYYLNYNSTQCFTYHTRQITSQLNASQTHAEKMEKLALSQKKVNQAQVKPGISYDRHAPSLKSLLGNYLSEEIEYQARLQQLGDPAKYSVDAILVSFRIKLELSVAQFAYLIRIFTELNIIRNNNLTELLRFFSKFVMSKRTENISFDSMRLKFYNVELGTRESVKAILVKMIHHIEKN